MHLIIKRNRMIKGIITFIIATTACIHICIAQNVSILDYSVNNYGQVQLEIEGKSDEYYLLTAQHAPNNDTESITSITMGVDGIMTISEPLAAYPVQNYKITAYDISNPEDFDGDGIDDITELSNMPTQAPLNFAQSIPLSDGTTSLDDYNTYSELAVINEDIPWAPFLNNQEFVKFAILNQNSDFPEVYFINSKTHYIHANFLSTIDTDGDDVTTGEIVYNPNEILPNGAFGSYSFNYSFGNSYPFNHTRRTFELLAANMPYLQNNLQHFIGDGGEAAYLNQYIDSYEGSRIPVVLESEYFADTDFLPFNQAEGYGFFREMNLDENPGSRDIVLYDALPNSLPRVGGIITSVVQTPLSHVNLRAIQDNVPNAYIREPLQIDSIANLIGKYIYYKVEQEQYTLREATLEEVNTWYENIRPTETQIPERDLSFTEILPLDSIGFEMSTSFGAKCSNVATMRTFGFPEGTIPNGFGVPFYYYDEFMKYNDFYTDVEEMITDQEFINDLEERIDMLKDFRKKIKDADMPQWMLDSLQVMHESFPTGTSIRCRSSTNNEDLPGFSGAGLYTSKTQHPDEGHISKSIKQVYASMWNFRAYDERDFYRVDHYIAAMGVLCHPNYEDEKSNGVGVSIDPVYQTENTFYLNTQVGESLITNPDANSIPEEILLNEDPEQGYFVLRNSNLVHGGNLVMAEPYLDLMRIYLKKIHDEFAVLYNVEGAEGFGMDIEYKVTSADQLIIKQARPWVSFWADIKATFDLAAVAVSNPQSSASLSNEEYVTVSIANRGLRTMSDFDITLLLSDIEVETIHIETDIAPQRTLDYTFTTPIDLSDIEEHHVSAIVSHESDGYATNDSLNVIISKLHQLEGGISIVNVGEICGEEVIVTANVANYGESTFVDTEIEIIVNGLSVDTFRYDFSIPYQVDVDIPISVTQNLHLSNNEITLKIHEINGEQDAISNNNQATITTDLETDFNYINLIITPDNYPQETSYEVYDELTNTLLLTGNLTGGEEVFTEEICVNYNSCISVILYDSYGDGICCDYGEGNFIITDAMGDTLAAHDGIFSTLAEELFCPTGVGCQFTAEVVTTLASDSTSADGAITINPINGLDPYEFSIDGGETFNPSNTYHMLDHGIYDIVVRDASKTCYFEETVILEVDVMSGIDDLGLSTLTVYPNPTQDILIIQLDDASHMASHLQFDLYNTLGKLIQSSQVKTINSTNAVTLSLKDLTSGSYILKCYNDQYEKQVNVVKM